MKQFQLQAAGGVFSLEVETNEGNVAIAYPVSLEDVTEACSYLTHSLADKGITVYTDYGKFKDFIKERGF